MSSSSDSLHMKWLFWAQWVLVSAFGWAIGSVVRKAVVSVPVSDANLRSIVGFAVWAMVGAAVGGMQWLVLRRQTQQAGWWVLVSALGVGVANSMVPAHWILQVIRFLDQGMFAAAFGGIAGAVIGMIEWFILRWWVRRSGWWILVSAVGMAIGNAVARVMALPFEWHLVVSGALCEGLRGLVLVWLRRNPVPEESKLSIRLLLRELVLALPLLLDWLVRAVLAAIGFHAGSVLEAWREIFGCSGSLFSKILPSEWESKLSWAIESETNHVGAIGATVAANSVPFVILAIIIYAGFTRKSTSTGRRIWLAVAWSVLLIEVIGAVVIGLVVIALSGLGPL